MQPWPTLLQEPAAILEHYIFDQIHLKDETFQLIIN
jgi:hypothetical protein